MGVFQILAFPHIGKSKELAEKYAEAKVAKEMNEAHKLAEEAAEIAAQKDLKNAKKTS